MVGVGIAITPHVREIPGAMIEAADAAGLPLVRVPAGTPFRKVTSYVSGALASRDMHRLRRSMALQQRLLEILVAEQDVDAFVGRLGELLGVTTVLLGADGRVVACSPEVVPGDADQGVLDQAWQAYRGIVRQGMPRSVMSVAGRNIAFREIHAGGLVEHVLVAVHPPNSLIPEFADASLSFVQRLLEMELATTQNAAQLRRRTRARLLEMLLGRRGGEAELAERLLHHGIEVSDEWRLVALQVEAGEGAPVVTVGSALAAVDAILEERLIPFVSCPDGDRVLVLSPLGPPPDDAAGVRRLTAEIAGVLQARLRAGRVAAGVSEPMTGAAAAPRAAGQAKLALGHALEDAAAGVAVLAFDDLGLAHRLLDSLPEPVLEQLARAVLGELRSADRERDSDLVHTLTAYLERGCSVAETAADLYVHRNTLRKRLARIEACTGLDLGTTQGRVEAYLSAQAEAMLERRRA
jgi:sugar diacid utilization regulator